MAHIIVLIAFAAIVNGLFYWASLSRDGDWQFAIGMVLTVALIFYIFIVPVLSVSGERGVNAFIQQSEYLLTHEPDNAIEDAALTAKKIELNEWLFNAQWAKEKFGSWSLYPDEVMELEPID